MIRLATFDMGTQLALGFNLFGKRGAIRLGRLPRILWPRATRTYH